MLAETVIDRTPADVFGGRRSPRAVVETQQLFGDANLVADDVDLSTAEADELAPAHPGVEGEVDHRLQVLGMGLGQGDALVPGEDRHRPGGDLGRADLGARIRLEAVLLDGRLQDAPQGAVVAVHR